MPRRLLRLLPVELRCLETEALTEKELTADVIAMARLFGWRIAHFRSVETKRQGWQTPVQGDGKGFPDLCLVRERVIFIELKVGKNKLAPEQETWRDWIIASGGEWHLITDKGWLDGQAEEILGHPHTSVRSVTLGGDAT